MFPATRPTRFYPIVDRDLCVARGIDPRAVALACLEAGVTLLQLRVKRGPSAAFLALADELVAAGRAVGADVIVNDRADIARMAGAAGVHVGQDDLDPAAVQRVFTGRLGLSTHDEAQVDEAMRSPADHVAVGPIFSTATKDTGYSQRGLGLIAYAAGRGKPIVAIGGITLERAPDVIRAGAAAVAVISDLLVGDVEERARGFLRVLGG